MYDKAFMEGFEATVRKTILDFDLVSEGDKVIVAVSGGKDSTTALYLMKKFGYDVEGMTLDHLASDYGRKNLHNIKDYCNEIGVKLHVVDLRREYGSSTCYMKSMLAARGFRMGQCTVCGVVRRNVLNRKARELSATKLATGHNLDDEVQTLFMNYVRGDMACLARMGPRSGVRPDERFVQRIKPLYFCLEEEVIRYSKLRNFPVVYEPCPCSLSSYRTEVKGRLDGLEEKFPGTKMAMMENFLSIAPYIRKNQQSMSIKSCELCGEPSSNTVCRTCSLLALMQKPEKQGVC